MSNRRPHDRPGPAGLGDDPLADDEDPLVEAMYRPSTSSEAGVDEDEEAARSPGRPPSTRRRPLPDGQTFRLVTFSFYEEDVARLDDLLAEARAKGFKKVNRSQLVRLALRHVDLDGLPEEI